MIAVFLKLSGKNFDLLINFNVPLITDLINRSPFRGSRFEVSEG